jgi:hypothetical protein
MCSTSMFFWIKGVHFELKCILLFEFSVKGCGRTMQGKCLALRHRVSEFSK